MSNSKTTSTKIFGKNSVNEALDKGVTISKIWMISSKDPKLKEIEHRARKQKIPVVKTNRDELDKLSNFGNHRSIVAEICPINLYDEQYLKKDSIKKLIFPANIEDPHNLGAIIRSSYAFGIDAVMVTHRRSSPITETVIASSAGAALSMPIVRVGNAVNMIEKLKKQGFWIYGTDVSDSSQDFNSIEFDEKSVIVMGNEKKGLPENLKKHCDFLIHIPCNFESLNVSVATGIVLNKLYTDSQNHNKKGV